LTLSASVEDIRPFGAVTPLLANRLACARLRPTRSHCATGRCRLEHCPKNSSIPKRFRDGRTESSILSDCQMAIACRYTTTALVGTLSARDFTPSHCRRQAKSAAQSPIEAFQPTNRGS
jgi:hypothetical protein